MQRQQHNIPLKILPDHGARSARHDPCTIFNNKLKSRNNQEEITVSFPESGIINSPSVPSGRAASIPRFSGRCSQSSTRYLRPFSAPAGTKTARPSNLGRAAVYILFTGEAGCPAPPSGSRGLYGITQDQLLIPYCAQSLVNSSEPAKPSMTFSREVPFSSAATHFWMSASGSRSKNTL